MNIQVAPTPQQNLLGGPENMVTELKTSIFIAPGESLPGVKQYFQIAKTIAGFVNGAGGTLWLGVADDGKVKGVEGDLAVLGGGTARSCRGPLSNDDGMAFGGTADQYVLKLNELDAAKFDRLPTDAYFKKYFADPKPHAKLSNYSTAPHKYGTSGKIRAKELGGKAYFANPDYAVQRLLALFGVDKARVALRG